MRREGLLTRSRDWLARVRGGSPMADHAVRAVDRYLLVQGSLLAAGMTYYGFLAVFPLVAVGLGVAAVLSKVAPSIDETFREQLEKLLPQLDLDAIATAGITVGIVGLVVMVYAGVKWIGALRRSMSVLWLQEPRTVPFMRGLLRDSLTLALLGGAVLVSVALTVVGQLTSSFLTDWLGDGASATLVRVASALAALVLDFLIGLILFRAVPGAGPRGRRLVVVAAVAGLGFEVLKQLGALIVGAASKNVVYGTFAATVGALVWIAYVSRWVLIVAAWAATDTPQGSADDSTSRLASAAEADVPEGEQHDDDAAEAHPQRGRHA